MTHYVLRYKQCPRPQIGGTEGGTEGVDQVDAVTSGSSCSKHEQHPSLLSLPAEIRVMIYDFVFSHPGPSDIPPRCRDSEYFTVPVPYMSTVQLLRPLLTCRQIYIEASIQAFRLASFRFRVKKESQAKPEAPPLVLSRMKASAIRSLVILDDTLVCKTKACHPSGRWSQVLTRFEPHRLGLEALEEITIWPDPVKCKISGKGHGWDYSPILTSPGSGVPLAVVIVLALVRNIPTLKRLVVYDVGTRELADKVKRIMDRFEEEIESPLIPDYSEATVFSAGYREWVCGLRISKGSGHWMLRDGDRDVVLAFKSP